MASVIPTVFACPVFEGSEKRVEIDFKRAAATPALGLRSLSRSQLDELMTAAACTIVSSRTNEALDAYVLSESSLFVYPTKFVLKTCGTTKLLNSLPLLLEFAAALGMEPRRCKFSRASFLFPDKQPAPHTSFDDETIFLRKYFGDLGNGGSAYVLGDKFQGLQWHIYVADADGIVYDGRCPTYTMEVCMTQLDKDSASSFFRTCDFTTARHTTVSTGIANLVPAADIDDYVFEPCGYSMNGILDSGFITIHVTPEDGFSYASVELSGFAMDAYEPSDLLASIVEVFKPGAVSVSLSVDLASKNRYAWGALPVAPVAYGCLSASCQELGCGGRVSYYTMRPPKVREGDPGSPVTVLQHMPSFSTLASSDSDNETSEEVALPLKRARISPSQVHFVLN